ncbi:MAG: glutaminyl-peptide cyclotransferase [Acidobacteria bacterium]|nr:MAG: glutaminyl-peptide cyclotransferase [Acidobacteriota bacterium]
MALACSSSALSSPPAEPLQLEVKVLKSYRHDPEAYTQGLIWLDGHLYESTGHYGRSTLRRVELETGDVDKAVALPEEFFGEGLAVVGDRLIQLSWREQTALLWDLASLERTGELSYLGEGWGLCYDGSSLYMSDGSDVLTVRDAKTLDEIGRLQVTLSGRPVGNLNELECAEGWIYANVYQTETLLRIDSDTGEVRATIDASGMLSAAERRGVDVLNGIAYNGDTGSFYLTGKLWPKLFEVIFVEK